MTLDYSRKRTTAINEEIKKTTKKHLIETDSNMWLSGLFYNGHFQERLKKFPSLYGYQEIKRI